MELERGGLSEGEDCSAPGEDGGFRAYCLGTSSEPWSSGWGVYVCLCDRCIRGWPLRGNALDAARSSPGIAIAACPASLGPALECLLDRLAWMAGAAVLDALNL